MHHLFIDIETIPGQKSGLYDRVAETIKPPANMTKAETIAKWEVEKKDAAVDQKWLKTALAGTFGEVVAIGWAIDEGEPRHAVRGLDDPEVETLNALSIVLNELGSSDLVWIGHNILGFDLRFLWQRYVVNGSNVGMRIPKDARPWDRDVNDTMTMWSGNKISEATSLNDLCFALGLKGKDGMDGGDVWQYIVDDRLEEVGKYVEYDVSRCRSIWRKLHCMDLLECDLPAVQDNAVGVF